MGQRRAVLAGGSGFIGQQILFDLERRGYLVSRVGRNGPDAKWTEETKIEDLIDGADLVINMAGKSVGCRYTDSNRNEILRSRVETTSILRNVIGRVDNAPRLWLNASTATIYRHAEDHSQTEANGELGSGFSVDVARSWENELFEGSLPNTRRVALRMAIVLGDGPALKMLATAARFGLGGPHLDGWWFKHRRYRGIGSSPSLSSQTKHQGHGLQRFSWIHIEDLIRIIEFIDANETIEGPVNCAAPNASTNKELMALLRKEVGMPVYVPTFRWMLETGMFILRQESELLLKSRWAEPELLTTAGFEFKWNDLDKTLADLL